MNLTSIPKLLRSRTRHYGPKPVLYRYGPSGTQQEFTWFDVWAGAVAVAERLLDAGLPCQHRVAIVSQTSAASLVAELGAMLAGGVAVPIHPVSDPLLAKSLLEEVEPALVLAPPAQHDGIRSILSQLAPAPRLLLLPEPPGDQRSFCDPRPDVLDRIEATGPTGVAVSWPVAADWTGPGSNSTAPGAADPTARTSGLAVPPAHARTAPARFVDLMHQNLVATAEAVARRLGASEADRWVALPAAPTPFFRVAGVYAPLLSGGEIVLLEAPSVPSGEPGSSRLSCFWIARPSIAIATIEDASGLAASALAEVQRLSGWSRTFAFLALRHSGIPGPWGAALPDRFPWRELARIGQTRIRHLFGDLSRIVLGPGPAPSDLLRVFDAFGVSACPAYGVPEASGLVSLAAPGEALPEGSCGRPLDGVQVEISGQNEIVVSGPTVMLSYRKVEAHANPVLTNGRLHTRHLGRLDEDGHLFPIGPIAG